MASTDALPIPRKNVAYRVYFPIMKSDGTVITGWTVPAATHSLDAATAGPSTNTPTEIATTWGIGYLDLTAAEMNCDCLAIKITVTNVGAIITTLVLYPMEDVDIRSNVVDWSSSVVNGLISGKVDTINSMVAGSASAGAANSITLAGASATDNLYKYSLVQIVGGTGAGQVRVILDYVGSTKVATIGKAWTTTPDNTSVYVVIPFAEPEIVHAGIAQAGAASTITLQSIASATDNIFNGDVIVLIGGTGNLQSRVITAYNGTTKVATVDQAWVTNPDSSSIYKVMSFGRSWSDVFMWNGTAVATPATAGIPEVDVKNINNVSASSVTTVNANQGTTQPENFTGTAASALVKVDAIDWASGAIPAPAVTGVPKTDLAYILGTLLTEAAGQLAGGFKKFFNIAAPAATMDHGVLVDTATTATTATTAVNLTNAPTNGDFTTAMKDSLNASTPASVTTVTGNVDGNVTGSVGSVVATVAANLTQILGSVLTEGASGRIVAAFKQFFNIAAPTSTMNEITLVDTATALGSAYDAAKTAATQASVNAIPTNPLLTNDGRLNALDAPISGIPTNPLLTTDTRLNDLDAPISGIPTNPLLTNDARLPAGSTPISTLTQAQILSDATPFPGADIALIKTKTDLITTPLTLTQIVNGVWNELLAGHTTPGSAAQLLIDASTAADAPTVPQIVNGILNELLAGHTTPGSVAVAIELINAVYAIVQTIGAGVTFVRSPVSANGDTEVRLGVRYSGVYALHYTSNSSADLLASGITVALNFANQKFLASSVTGAPGAWHIYVGISETQTAVLVLGTYDAQLALYANGVEVPELSNFKMTVAPNP